MGYPKKQIECDKCGRVTEIPKSHTLKESWCKECGSQKIRLYRERKANETKELAAGRAK